MSIDEELKNVFDAAPVAMLLSGPDGSLEYVNRALLDMLGYDQTEIYGEDVIISHPDDIHLNAEIRKKLRQNPFSPVVIEKRYLHKSGRVIEGLLTLAAQPDSSGNVQRMIAQIIDLSSQKEIEKSLTLFRTLVQYSNDSIFIVDAKTSHFLDVNDVAAERLQYKRDELLSLGVVDIEALLPDDFSWQAHVEKLKQSRSMMAEGKHKRKDGSVFPVEVSISYLVINDDEYVIAVARDTTERQQSQELIWKQANFDSLTGLPNRSMLTSRLHEVIKQTARSDKDLSILTLDLDGFKDVNDSYGHSIGDRLLMDVAERIKESVRDTDLVSRMGGDEFVIVLTNIDDTDTIERVTNGILKNLARPFHLSDCEVFVTVSIGVAFFPKDGNTSESLLKRSDQAMYQAKHDGKNCYRYFDTSMQAQADRRMLLNTALRKALSLNQFTVLFQPIVDISSGRVCAAETLLRWRHPELGQVGPQEFIPITETNGTIVEIGDWVYRQAVAFTVRVKEQYIENFRVSVNTSPIQFRGGLNTFEVWRDLLLRNGLDRAALILEITEGTMMEDKVAGVQDALRALGDMGFQVALDDFGTGYSSLAYLKKLDIDFLKIDRSFVQKMTEDSEDFALCEAIIVMAHKLKLLVVAEGVETKEQWQVLKSLGCDFGQGYFFSRPLPEKEFIQLLNNDSGCG